MAGIVQYVHFLTREWGALDHQLETTNPNKSQQILKEGRVEDLFETVDHLSIVV